VRPTRPDAPPIRMHLFVEGRVQGLWLRDTVYHQATARGVSGWVLPHQATCPKAHQSRVH